MSDSPAPETPAYRERQREIARWFDSTYSDRGVGYLRPGEAYEIFLEILGATPDESLLDIACGPGLLLECAQMRGLEVAGIDISAVAIENARARLPDAVLAVSSAEALPACDNSFDYITCIGSLERFLSPDVAIREMRRVLKPHGKLLLMGRNSRTLGWQLLRLLGLRNEVGHQGADDYASWRTRLEGAGFVIQAVYPDQWPLMRWQRLRHWWDGSGNFRSRRSGYLPLAYANELIFLCSKRDSR
jgi:SAM-dependent methyltransferase